MTTETEVDTAAEQPTATETSEAVHAAYDRIANPDKVADEPKEEVTPTAEMPPEVIISPDEVKALKAQVARIPELEKRLRDEGGRYGALKQSLEQIQQRIADKQEASGSTLDMDEVLADIKEHFGEDELYTGLRTAFSKLANVRGGADPEEINRIVSEKIQLAKQAETQAALELLTERHPTWSEDRETDDFKEWRDSLSAKDRDKFNRSKDPEYVADKLDEFNEWKAKKVAAPEKVEQKPEQKPEKPAPSKRLTNAVLPTNGTKPKASGEDKKSQVLAAYERVAGNRR